MNEASELRIDAIQETRWTALTRRCKTEEESLLRAGPWTSLAQLPRDYQPGLRARAWWSLEGDGILQARDAPATLLMTLQNARQELVKEYKKLEIAGKISPERECIHGRPAQGFGEWMQYDFLGGAAAARQRAASSTTVLLDRPQCERGVAPAGCAAAAAAETVLRDGGWGSGVGGFSTREPLVLRAGYSAVEPGAWIRPHFGETNAQLKLHFGLTVPTDSSGKPCALLRVGTSITEADGGHESTNTHHESIGEWRGWTQGGILLFDDSFEHEVKVQRPNNGTGNAGNHCSETRVVLQLVLRHPDLWTD